MLQLFPIYRAFIKTTAAVQIQYRVAMIIWLIGTVLEPVMYLIVWSNVAIANGGSTGGFTVPEFAGYFLVLMVVDQLTFTWHMWEYDYRIREGLLSPMLLRPVHPIHADVAENLGYKVLTMLVFGPAVVLLWLFFEPVLDPPAWAVVAFIPAVLLAFGVRFLTGWALAMLAFWTTRIEALNQTFFVTELFLSGRLAPLSLFPAWVQGVANVLPFAWTLNFPVLLLLGRLTPQETLRGLAMQAIWLVISVVLVRLVWRAGVRHYSAVGA